MSAPANSDALARFVRAGIAQDKAEQSAKSAKVCKQLEVVLDDALQAGGKGEYDANIGLLLWQLATTFPPEEFMAGARRFVVGHIVNARIKNVPQLLAANEFFKKIKSKYTVGSTVSWQEDAFNKACGVGIVYTTEHIRSVLAKVIAENKEILKEERYHGAVKIKKFFSEELKFADRKVVEDEYAAQLLALLGPETEEDKAPKTGPKKKKPEAKEPTPEAKAPKAEPAVAAPAPAALPVEEADDYVVGREIPDAINTEDQLKRHLAATHGKVITRFPPEPNGFLHLGHAKSINFNFGVAKRFNGETILRFDDTNPEAEDQLFIDKIIECVEWLGFKPVRVTYSSDYFPQLYELAIKLIKSGRAYVCHQKGPEIEESRKNKTPSPWRDRSVEENLRLFERMRKGLYAEGEATLRMKQDITSPNPTMWDLVAYRIKYHPHPHVGDKWCIYPSYDFTHCIIDSLENVTHSLCTLEFEVRRESYFWLLAVLDLYKPKVWEFSRLDLEYTVMSKRKLKALVEEKWVEDWDDPRMITLMGLRRRGFTPDALNYLCSKVGISRNANVIAYELLEHCARVKLDDVAVRAFVVQSPLRVVLTNYPADKVEYFEAPKFPQNPENGGTRKLPLTRIVYIDREDFRMQDEKDYYGLAPNKEVYLKYGYSMTCTNVVTNAQGEPEELHCTVDFTSREKRKKKVKGHLHWVAEPQPGKAPLSAVVRLYDRLFNCAEPGGLDNWREFVNRDSLKVCPNAFCEPAVASAQKEDKFQFERLGYYVADFSSTPERLIFNRTVQLKDRKGKPGQGADE